MHKDRKRFLRKVDGALLVVSVVLLLSVVFSGAVYYKAQELTGPISEEHVLSAQTVAGDGGNGSLQLKTFTPPPTKPPTQVPVRSTVYNPPQVTSVPIARTPCSETPGGCTVTMPPIVPTKAKDCNTEGFPPCCPGVNVTEDGPLGPTVEPGPWCDSKPVIYLYPQKPMSVSVQLTLPGRVTESIPTYPKDGWQNITAYPGGKLAYQGKEYRELYYESVITRAAPEPMQGIVAAPSEYRDTLVYFGTRLGLNISELKEFVSYWMGRLSAVKSPYMFFSYYPTQDKQKIDGVVVSPKPDTSIEFIMYFKPLEAKESVAAPVFDSVPSRQGFTEVEWGGILDY